jgi:hypothetical protein
VFMMISDAELLRFNEQGLIPGPGESEEAFLARAYHCLKGVEAFEGGIPYFPGQKLSALTTLLNDDPFASTKALYDIQPLWVAALVSSKGLAPWHGGCAWIYNGYPESPTSAFLQLRGGVPIFYHQKELVAHELAHVGRMEFHEQRFEEFLAYQSSQGWRKLLGPIVESGNESILFVGLLAFIFILDFLLLITDNSELFMWAAWLKLLPVSIVGMAFWRLQNNHKLLRSALEHVSQAIADPSKASAVVYRLTDSEIELFANRSSLDIKQYAKDHRYCELRWYLLCSAYFSI